MIRHPFSTNVVSRIVGAGHNVVDVEVTHDHAVEEIQAEIPGNAEWRTVLVADKVGKYKESWWRTTLSLLPFSRMPMLLF